MIFNLSLSILNIGALKPKGLTPSVFSKWLIDLIIFSSNSLLSIFIIESWVYPWMDT